MYLGKIVEYSTTRDLFENPLHPYTKALLDAVPIPDPMNQKVRKPLSGNIPSPIDIPSGCRFRTRCPYVMNVCSKVEPPLDKVLLQAGTLGSFSTTEKQDPHSVACYLYTDEKKTSSPS
jgi:oligopeptide/dipeptide ABC transporter ATP-binding protein